MASVLITLTAIDVASGDCTFTMKRGTEANIVQKVSNMPLNDATAPVQAFVDAATKYAVGYYAGADGKVPPVIAPQVTALVGQSKTVTI